MCFGEGVPNHLSHVAVVPDVWKVGHHVGDNLEAGILSIVEALVHSLDRVPPVCIAGHVFVHTLDPNLKPGATCNEK